MRIRRIGKVLGLSFIFLAILLPSCKKPSPTPTPIKPEVGKVTFELLKIKENPETGYWDILIKVRDVEGYVLRDAFSAWTGYRFLSAGCGELKKGDILAFTLQYPESFLRLSPRSHDVRVLGSIMVKLPPEKRADIEKTEAMRVARGIKLEGGKLVFGKIPEGWVKGEEGVLKPSPEIEEKLLGYKKGERFISIWKEEEGEILRAVRAYIKRAEGIDLEEYLTEKHSVLSLFNPLYGMFEWMDKGETEFLGEKAFYLKSFHSPSGCNFIRIKDLPKALKYEKPEKGNRCEAFMDIAFIKDGYLINVEVWSDFETKPLPIFPPHTVLFDGLRDILILKDKKIPYPEYEEDTPPLSYRMKKLYPSLKPREGFELKRIIYERVGGDEIGYVIAQYRDGMGFGVEGWEQASFLFSPIDTPGKAIDYVRFIAHEIGLSAYTREHKELESEVEFKKALEDMKAEGEFKVLREPPIRFTRAKPADGGFIVERLYMKRLIRPRIIYEKWEVSREGKARRLEGFVCAEGKRGLRL